MHRGIDYIEEEKYFVIQIVCVWNVFEKTLNFQLITFHVTNDEGKRYVAKYLCT